MPKEREEVEIQWTYLFDDLLATCDPEPLVHPVIGDPKTMLEYSQRDIICHYDRRRPQHESPLDDSNGTDSAKNKFVTGSWIRRTCNARLRYEGIHDSWGSVWACICEGLDTRVLYYHLDAKDGNYQFQYIDDPKVDEQEGWSVEFF